MSEDREFRGVHDASKDNESPDKTKPDKSTDVKHGKPQPVLCTPSIVPNSARSLKLSSKKDRKLPEVIIEPGNVSWNVIDSWDETMEEMATSSQSDAHQNEDLNEVICLDDQEDEEIISGRPNGGGFVVNGAIELDYRNRISDFDMTGIMESEDDDVICTTRQEVDDSIVFVDVVQHQGLIPQVHSGYVKEFIDDNPKGLGILFSQECGKCIGYIVLK